MPFLLHIQMHDMVLWCWLLAGILLAWMLHRTIPLLSGCEIQPKIIDLQTNHYDPCIQPEPSVVNLAGTIIQDVLLRGTLTNTHHEIFDDRGWMDITLLKQTKRVARLIHRSKKILVVYFFACDATHQDFPSDSTASKQRPL